MSDHDALRDNAGAWVLGALDDEEAWRFSAHLEVCASCRDEVERLQVAADALPLGVPPAAPPPELKTRLMEVVEREAREQAPRSARHWSLPSLFTRPAFAAAAAALALVVGGAIGFALQGGGETKVVALTTATRGASAELVRTGDQTEVRVTNMPAPPRGRVYQVWIKRPGRPPSPDAVFTVDREGRGSVGVRGDLDGAEAVLVTDEPQGGSRVPTREPVVTGRPA